MSDSERLFCRALVPSDPVDQREVLELMVHTFMDLVDEFSAEGMHLDVTSLELSYNYNIDVPDESVWELEGVCE